MPHLVTAAAPEDHVTSANTAHYHAGTIGNGKYLLPGRKGMACTLVNSNTLRILAGDAGGCGRQWEVSGAYEEVTLENGTPGYNRIDLVVARLETDPQESVAFKVIRGEDTTGTPVTPGHEDGDLNDGDILCDMPICSVQFSGINPQEPKMLLQESHTIEGLYADLSKQINDVRDSLSQTKAYTFSEFKSLGLNTPGASSYGRVLDCSIYDRARYDGYFTAFDSQGNAWAGFLRAGAASVTWTPTARAPGAEWAPRFWWWGNFPWNKPAAMHKWGRFLRLDIDPSDTVNDGYFIAISTNGTNDITWTKA